MEHFSRPLGLQMKQRGDTRRRANWGPGLQIWILGRALCLNMSSSVVRWGLRCVCFGNRRTSIAVAKPPPSPSPPPPHRRRRPPWPSRKPRGRKSDGRRCQRSTASKLGSDLERPTRRRLGRPPAQHKRGGKGGTGGPLVTCLHYLSSRTGLAWGSVAPSSRKPRPFGFGSIEPRRDGERHFFSSWKNRRPRRGSFRMG